MMDFRNFRLNIDSEGIATVTWDMPGRSMNLFDARAIDEIGAIVLYDRLISLGGYPGRPIAPGGKAIDLPPPHKWGEPMMRKKPR